MDRQFGIARPDRPGGSPIRLQDEKMGRRSFDRDLVHRYDSRGAVQPQRDLVVVVLVKCVAGLSGRDHRTRVVDIGQIIHLARGRSDGHPEGLCQDIPTHAHRRMGAPDWIRAVVEYRLQKRILSKRWPNVTMCRRSIASS